MTEEQKKKIKAVLFRFAKGFISGAITTMTLVPFVTVTSWKELQTWICALTIAGCFGGINGMLLAAQKYYSWKD